MKMSRSVMGHLFHDVAIVQCGIRPRIAQTFLRFVRGLRFSVGAWQSGAASAGISPEEIGAAGRDADGGRGLGNAQPREIAELDQFGCLRIGAGQPFEGGVDVQHLVETIGSGGGELVEVQANAISVPFLALLATGIIDENPAHGLGRGGEEVAAAVPVQILLGVHKTQIGFMHEGGRQASGLASPATLRQPRAVVDQREAARRQGRLVRWRTGFESRHHGCHRTAQTSPRFVPTRLLEPVQEGLRPWV